MTGSAQTEPTTTEPGQHQTDPEPAAQATPATADPAPAADAAAQATAPGSTMSVHKHQREMQRVEAERDAAKAEAEGYKGLKAEFDAWKAEQAAAKAEAALKAAGCIDTVAASARLTEFGGDVEKLKGAAPYLFASSDNSKSTGGNPKGTPDPEDERTKKMRETFGLTNE